MDMNQLADISFFNSLFSSGGQLVTFNNETSIANAFWTSKKQNGDINIVPTKTKKKWGMLKKALASAITASAILTAAGCDKHVEPSSQPIADEIYSFEYLNPNILERYRQGGRTEELIRALQHPRFSVIKQTAHHRRLRGKLEGTVNTVETTYSYEYVSENIPILDAEKLRNQLRRDNNNSDVEYFVGMKYVQGAPRIERDVFSKK